MVGFDRLKLHYASKIGQIPRMNSYLNRCIHKLPKGSRYLAKKKNPNQKEMQATSGAKMFQFATHVCLVIQHLKIRFIDPIRSSIV